MKTKKTYSEQHVNVIYIITPKQETVYSKLTKISHSSFQLFEQSTVQHVKDKANHFFPGKLDFCGKYMMHGLKFAKAKLTIFIYITLNSIE